MLEALTADLAQEQDQVLAQILVEDEATAQEVLGRLNAGEDFPALAAEYSTNNTNASSTWTGLAWAKWTLNSKKSHSTRPSARSAIPCRTTFGWHIIQVLGHEMRL